MRKTILTTVFLFLSSVVLLGQVSDIEKEITEQPAGKSFLISKGRQLLLDKFVEDNWQKVNEITDYLLQIEDTNYVALYPAEYWYILYWTQAYPELLMDIRRVDSITIASFYSRIRPSKDMLGPSMYKKTLANKNRLKEQIHAAKVGQREKDFLNLHLDWLLADTRNVKTQDSLNELADHFLATYDSTAYDVFIRNEIRYKLVPDNFGVTYDATAGYGMFTDNLVDNYTNPFVFSIGVGALYKGFDFSLNLLFVTPKNKKEILYSQGVVSPKSNFTMAFPHVVLGHQVFDNKYFRITPYMGIGGSSIESPKDKNKTDEENQALKDEVDLGMKTTFVGGCKLEIKLRQHIDVFFFSYSCISLKYNYIMPSFQTKHEGMSGGLHTITIGFSGGARWVKRAY